MDPYSKIDQSKSKYRVLKDLGSLKSEEWRLIKSNSLEDLPTMYSMWLQKFRS